MFQFLLHAFAPEPACCLAVLCCTLAELMCSHMLRMLETNARVVLQWSQVISQPTETIAVPTSIVPDFEELLPSGLASWCQPIANCRFSELG